MALISVDYFSSCLMRTTTLEVILPIDDQGAAYATDSAMRHAGGTLEAEMRTWEQHPYPPKKAPFKTLFLLHGISGNHADWISETRIRNWAENHGIAVVMPSGYNAFYLDQPEVHNYYGRFVGQELVEVARRMFPLSTRREDTSDERRDPEGPRELALRRLVGVEHRPSAALGKAILEGWREALRNPEQALAYVRKYCDRDNSRFDPAQQFWMFKLYGSSLALEGPQSGILQRGDYDFAVKVFRKYELIDSAVDYSRFCPGTKTGGGK